MHLYTCKSLLNTSGRAVEQLDGCLVKQSNKSAVGVKVQQHAMPARMHYEYLIR